MALDISVFKLLFAQYLSEFELESVGLWALADDVFVAQVKEQRVEGVGYIFFHDISRVHFRDTRNMCSEIAVLAVSAECGKMTQDEEDTMHVIFLWGKKVSNCPLKSAGSVYHAATQLLVSSDGGEVAWYGIPKQIK